MSKFNKTVLVGENAPGKPIKLLRSRYTSRNPVSWSIQRIVDVTGRCTYLYKGWRRCNGPVTDGLMCLVHSAAGDNAYRASFSRLPRWLLK